MTMKDNRTYIGIDVGGTFIKLGIIADDGRILKRHKVSVDRSGRMGVMDTIISAVKELCSMCGNDPNAGAAPESRNSEAAPVKPGEASAREIRSDCMSAEGSFGRPAGIGICAPGSIDTVNGRVAINGGNVPDWSGTEIRSILEKKFGIPVAVANDGNCAVLGEAWTGAARGCSDVVCVTLGTGVGGGIISGGRLLGGRHGFAGEIGHFPIHPGEGDICECGSRGCYESFASASALVKKASSVDPSWNDGHAIFAAVDAGNEEALSLVDGKVVMGKSKCNHCGRCVKACPADSWDYEPGYIVSFGGLFGNKIYKGEEIVPIIKDKETLFRVADAAINFFDKHAKPGERFRLTLQRVGEEEFRKEIRAAYEGK